MLRAQARIVSSTGSRITAAAARISTTEGTALSYLDQPEDTARDRKLVAKVLASGHATILEHEVLNVALDQVSVLAEQFLIESRLASFTVKSRRYVDFSNAGYHVPDELQGMLKTLFEEAVDAQFSAYRALLDLGVPREDARFVLPYCFYSNLYMTLNARSLLRLICDLRYGRGAGCSELEAIGAQLADQFEALHPGEIDRACGRFKSCAVKVPSRAIQPPEYVAGRVSLIGAPVDAGALLREALAFTDRFQSPFSMRDLVEDARPRELELLSYAFSITDVSLACVTHFARHRIQSPLFEPSFLGIVRGHCVCPATVAAIPAAEKCYRDAFEEGAKNARALLRAGMPTSLLGYLSMSGHTVPLMFSMNARELLHFVALRACNRAQWEIQNLTTQMLELLRRDTPELFSLYGPLCARTGACPEGRLSCGSPKTL